jgi:hypothetical protein
MKDIEQLEEQHNEFMDKHDKILIKHKIKISMFDFLSLHGDAICGKLYDKYLGWPLKNKNIHELLSELDILISKLILTFGLENMNEVAVFVKPKLKQKDRKFIVRKQLADYLFGDQPSFERTVAYVKNTELTPSKTEVIYTPPDLTPIHNTPYLSLRIGPLEKK